MNISGNKILITGGGSGIGLALAERFVAEKNTVIVCGRRAAALKDASVRVPGLVTRQADVSTAEGREGLYRWIAAEHPDTTVLVNNAGIQNWMSVTDADFMRRAEEEITVNVTAPLHLSTLFLELPALKTIVNVTSGLAFVPLTKVPVYCATKAFLHSFTLSLRELVRARGVEVVELVPPALNTDLGGKGIHDHAPPVSGFVDAVFAQLAEGKTTATFGFTEALSRAGQDVVEPIFKRMNQLA
ncbi:MAG TPA: SDR family NAD(P)-dependent oxidoreductase [Polyangiaceae bacterium]|nr:SDR family NAD(P)-dependent oxidoreductase [Polyangiaceae bacterium]